MSKKSNKLNPKHEKLKNTSIIMQALAQLSRSGAVKMAQEAVKALDRLTTIVYPEVDYCPTCQGMGGITTGKTTIGTCPDCNGTGLRK